MRKMVLVVATAVAVAAMGGVASATTYKGKASVQHNNGNCGHPVEGEPITGTANFTRKGNLVKVSYKAKDLVPGTAYTLELFGNGCVFLGDMATFEPNAKGVGKAKGELTVPAGDTEFFADAWNGSQGNDSFIVTLP